MHACLLPGKRKGFRFHAGAVQAARFDVQCGRLIMRGPGSASFQFALEGAKRQGPGHALKSAVRP